MNRIDSFERKIKCYELCIDGFKGPVKSNITFQKYKKNTKRQKQRPTKKRKRKKKNGKRKTSKQSKMKSMTKLLRSY